MHTTPPATNRRHFLHTLGLGGIAVFSYGCRTPGSTLTPPGDSTPPQDFHVSLLSDTHIPGDRLNGHRGFSPWLNLEQVVPRVIEADPEAVILTGDAARLEGKTEDYQELRRLLQPLTSRVPVHIGLGNHDDRKNFLQVFTERPGVVGTITERHVSVIEHPLVRLVLLDSLLYVNQTAGLIGKTQRAWLTEYLPRIADRPVFLCVHHTLGDGDGELLDADYLFALAARHPQIKAIVYGHSHVWSLTQRERLQLINLPAVGYNFRDQDPVGWVDARFHKGGVDLTLHAVAGHRAEDGKVFPVAWLR